VTYCPYCSRFTTPARCAEPGCGGYVCGTCAQCNRKERFHGLADAGSLTAADASESARAG